jgi:hypothetical protein
VEDQLGKVVEIQTLILAEYAGKPKPNPVADLKMMRSSLDGDKFDYGNAPTPDYTVEDLMKMNTLKNPIIDGGNQDAYQIFINSVAEMVHGLEMEYKRLSKNLFLSWMTYLRQL